jgi:hypothetical protein
MLPALIAIAAAQSESFSVKATATAPSGPVDTSSACGQVASLIKQTGLMNPSIDAEVSFRECYTREWRVDGALGDTRR